MVLHEGTSKPPLGLVIIRWLAVLPAAYVAERAVSWLYILFQTLFARMFPRDAHGFIWVSLVAGALGAYAFMMAGTALAPSRKKVAALVLAVLCTVFFGVVYPWAASQTGVQTWIVVVSALPYLAVPALVYWKQDWDD